MEIADCVSGYLEPADLPVESCNDVIITPHGVCGGAEWAAPGGALSSSDHRTTPAAAASTNVNGGFRQGSE